jgi:putative ABC transport system permease protein
MFSNYFKTAFRSLIRNRSYAAINIIGLAVGIAACLLIFLVVQFETSFDQFHSQKNKIYRVVSQSKTADGVNYSSGVPFPVAGSLRIDFPQLENVAAIFAKDDPEIIIPAGDHHQTIKKFKEEQVFFTEPQFFKVFDFNWLAGDQKTALAEPNTALLSKETAKKYFGDWTKAIDQTIKYDNKYLVRITGVLEDVPANSDFPLRLVISYATLNNTDLKTNLDDWNTIFSDAYCFVVLPSTLPAARFDNWLVDFAKRHQTGKNARDMGMILQPLREMHYDSRFGVFSNHIFGKDILTAISLIGLFLLIIACSNFINLATAQAVNRSKEVGVRKVLGCRRAHLISQFMAETFLITLFAMALAIVITFTILPLLNELLQIQLHFKILSDPAIILFIAFTIGVVGILSGIYPAFVLSGFNPIQSLKIKITPKSAGGIPLRRILVIMQFCIAQVLIMGTLVVVSQMDYLRNAPLGFSKDAIINIPIPQNSSDLHKLGALRNQLLQQPGIRNISFCFSSPSADGNWNSDFNFDHATKRTDFSANLKWADANYFKTYDLHFVAGGPYAAGDTVKGFVVNEMLLQKLGIRTPQEAIGKYLDFWNKTLYAPIVGVIKDFNVRSLRKPIVPVVIGSWQAVYQQASIHVQPADMIPVLEAVEKIWNNDFPDYYFEYHFLDQQIADFYKQERQLTELYKIFAAIAILLSCFGLYGLVSFMTVQRTKEVGIRKVLGASVINILYLLSKEFTVLILSAFVIAAPVAYYLMHRWLLQYTFRISPGADLFLLTMSASLAIAWGTAGYQAFRAALANPVESLRNE